jgi:hypothetical protein
LTAAITGGAGDHGDELLRIGREVVERRLQLGVHLRLMAFISAGWFSVVVVARSAFDFDELHGVSEQIHVRFRK